MCGSRLVNRKNPVSPDMNRKLVNRSTLYKLLELRKACSFLLAYSGFFRIKEGLHVWHGDLHVHSGYVSLNI